MAISRKIGAAKSFVSYFPKPGGGDACQFSSTLWNPFSSKRISLSLKSKTLRNLVSPHYFGGSSHNKEGNVLTGSTDLQNNSGCKTQRKQLEGSSGRFLHCSMVSFLKFGILLILYIVWLPCVPDCSHKASVLGSIRKHPHSSLPSRGEEMWLGGAGKRGERRHHPSN